MQPVFSPTVLTDMIKPDGSCAIPVLSGEPLSAELAHELMGIQVIFFQRYYAFVWFSFLFFFV